ncbi:MAG: helix-turn-helix domain-containing protein [Myxococcota bacterium]
MAKRRTYHQHCGLARALDVLGERWTLLVLRELLLGPRRYSDLLRSLEGITTNLLAERLEHLVSEGLIERAELPPPGRAQVYQLTARGAAVEPAILELGRWGSKLLEAPRRGDRRDPGWALVSMKRRFRPGPLLSLGLKVDERSFRLLGGEKLTIVEGELAGVEAVLELTGEAFFALFFQGAALGSLEREARLRVQGDRAIARAFLERLANPV